MRARAQVRRPHDKPVPIIHFFLQARSSAIAPAIGEKIAVMSMLEPKASAQTRSSIESSRTTTCERKIGKSSVLISRVKD